MTEHIEKLALAHSWLRLQISTFLISITITGIVAKLILTAFRVTEVIQFSLNVSKKLVYLLTVDAMSAYDRCLRQILSSQQYKADITGSALTFMNNRLASRATTYQ